ncbi:HEPN domain-containing protein [Candidatus Poribacteria bacterium]|nr:HEPN domain-containing protein [Candidatus Poribacteria bacterium]
MLTNEDIARAFLREAQSDLNSARVLTTVGEYARCIAHAQHTVEKTLKAVLAARGTIITDRHQVSSDFVSLCADVPDVARIAQISARLERMGSRSEYPLFGDPNRPIWIPSERYGHADAQQALDEATFVFDTLAQYLADQHGVNL